MRARSPRPVVRTRGRGRMTQPIGPPGSDGRWNIRTSRGERVTHTMKRHLIRTVVVGLAATAAAAAPAAAAPVGVGGGVTNLHLDRATAAALGDLGLTVAPVGPATASGARV